MAIETCVTTDIEKAAHFIREGEIVAFPTETVYGLGADAYNVRAVRKIFVAKGRPAENPLIVHVCAVQDIERAAVNISEQARVFMDSFFPGPLTLILEKRDSLPAIVSAGLPTVGVRMPGHDIALAFIKACDRLVAAPSANLSGKPSPTTWEAVCEDLDGKISCILQGEMTAVGLESTVLDCTVDPPEILRPGSTTLSELQRSVPATIFSMDLEPGKGERPKSPGTSYRHYTPEARVILVDHHHAILPDSNRAYIGLESPPDISAFRLSHIAPDVENYAKALFDFFRRCDRADVDVIYCQSVPDFELGLALMDRIRRASER